MLRTSDLKEGEIMFDRESSGGGGMGIAFILLAGFGLYVALRYYNVQVAVSKKQTNAVVAPAGVNFYCNQPVTQRFQQTQAYACCNGCQATVGGFAAAFGPNENQPTRIATLEI
jgi:hypothetical protein